MKTNLISSIASWKSAALLGLVALIATVAFSGVLSTTKTADAGKLGDIQIGGTATVSANVVKGGVADFTIAASDPANFGATGGDGKSVRCTDNATCDSNPADGVVTVTLKADDDATAGQVVVVSRGEVGDPAKTDYFVVVQADAARAGSLSATAAASSVRSSIPNADPNQSPTQGTVVITATVMNAATPASGLNGESLTVKTSLGSLDCGAQTCSKTTGSDGTATATLSSGFALGTAEVTVTHATLGKVTVKVILSGVAKTVELTAQQGAIQIGGETYVTVKITDAGGNPVPNQKASAVKATAPEGATGSKVGVANTVVQDKAPMVDNDDAADTAKNVRGAGDLPACADPPADADMPYDNALTQWSGTTTDGECVVKVTSVKGATATASTARGAHTVEVTFGTLKQTTTVNVGGPPSSIDHNAPPRVDELADTPIEVTVLDDAGVAVGVVPLTVDLVSGDGVLKVAAPVTWATLQTTDGKATFNYVAGLSGTAVIRVAAGAHADFIRIEIGPEPEPTPDPTWSKPIVAGWNNVAWNGEDGASIADNIGEGVNSVYQWNGSGFDAYFATAGDLPNANTLTSLSNGGVYWVHSD